MNLELTLCQKIKKLQKEKKISNSEAAKAIGIDPVNYSRKMSNNLMKAEEIDRLCQTFGIEIEIKNKTDTN